MFNQNMQKWIHLAKEYARLNSLPLLNEIQSHRLEEILNLATCEPSLNLWIQEIDFMTAQHIGLLNDKLMESYLDQQARLNEEHVFDQPIASNRFEH